MSEEIKIPKPIPLKDYGNVIRQTDTFKKYGFTINHQENSDYLLWEDRIYTVRIHNTNNDLSVFVKDLESAVCSHDDSIGPDEPYRSQINIYENCRMLAQFIKRQLLAEAKELYLKK